MSLPLELLEIIFEYCHLGRQWAIDDYQWENPSLSDTLRYPPYSLAAVDPSWNAILLRHRKYWTGLPWIVFNVDSKTPTHLEDAKTLMRHMLYEPDPDIYYIFHVAIIRHSKENPDDAAEKERVRNIMDLLAPEIRRFLSFLIDVHASSSLPAVTTYFNNLITSPLRSLEYQCDIDDVDDNVPHEPYDYGFASQGSNITSMVLDGCTFRRNTSWMRRHTKLKSLTVSHLSHATTDHVRGIVDVQRALETVCSMTTTLPWGASSDLKCLKFRDINFAPRDAMCRAFSSFMRLPVYVNLKCLSFEDVDPWFLEDLTQSIFSNTHPDFDHPAHMELHLICGASSRDIPLDVQSWRCARLVLEGYDQVHLTTSYPFDKDFFLSSELHLINCPGFTDVELEILSRVDPETKDPLFSSNLRYLKITDCHGFTIQALKDMVAVRAMGWQKRSRIPGRINRRLVTLEVNGYGTSLSDRDKDWFRIHVKNFSWDGSSQRRRSSRKLTAATN